MRRRGLMMLVAACCVLTACTGGGGVTPSSVRPSTATAVGPMVPNLVGLSTTEAVAVLDDRGLAFEIRTVSGAAPIVVRQDPAPGEPAVSGMVVVLEASCYPAPCPFPGEGKTIYDPCTCASRVAEVSAAA